MRQLRGTRMSGGEATGGSPLPLQACCESLALLCCCCKPATTLSTHNRHHKHAILDTLTRQTHSRTQKASKQAHQQQQLSLTRSGGSLFSASLSRTTLNCNLAARLQSWPPFAFQRFTWRQVKKCSAMCTIRCAEQ